MKGWRRLTEVGQAGLVVLVVLWKDQVTFKLFLSPFFAEFFFDSLSQEHQTRPTLLTHGSTTSFRDLILSMKLKIVATAEALHQLGLRAMTT